MMIHEVNDDIAIRVGDSTVTVPAKTILHDLLTRLQPRSTTTGSIPPAIGEFWPGQGGIYTGIGRGFNGGGDYHIITGPDISADNWDALHVKAAALEPEGCNDFTLPRRSEQSIQFGNIPERFDKSWYASCEQYAGSPDYAWGTNFDYGNQYYYLKDYSCRARPVRRLPI